MFELCIRKQSFLRKFDRLGLNFLVLIGGFAIASSNLTASPETIKPVFDRDMLNAVAELYGIDEEQAVQRLARETEAAIALKHIKGLSLESYAGSWFDESSFRLKVAISNPKEVVHLKPFDVDPVLVHYSLRELEEKLTVAKNQLNIFQDSNYSIANAYIDYESNRVVLGVSEPNVGLVTSELSLVDLAEKITVLVDNNTAKLSIGTVRAGDGTINENWQGLPPLITWPCSIGASIEDGYITAGHCGDAGHTYTDTDGNSLSTMQESMWFQSNPGPDIAYAHTVAGWIPAPLINGYSDGVFSVSSEWAGMLEFPIGSTVCRYGQTSGGPHCGTVNQKNFTQQFGSQYVTGLTRVSGSCSDDGDSGGPHVAGAGQIQGTNTGVIDFVGFEDCPNQALYVFFMPIKDSIDEFDVTMLTSHGSSAPTVNTANCPNMALSGQGIYHCSLYSADSQGEIDLQWTTSTGASSSSTWIQATCNILQQVHVTLKLTNPYGTTTKNYSFLCPSGPIQ